MTAARTSLVCVTFIAATPENLFEANTSADISARPG
jgi:hypothetical protein